MTGRTHDLAAFTALNLILVSQPVPQFGLSTALAAFGANMIGGLTPDIDQPTADLWHKIPAGSLIGKIISPILGGHRLISHSILGIFLFGFLSKYLLNLMSSVVLVDMNIVWFSFMVGFISHLIMDSLTREGVPWFFPVPVHLGLPPIKALRMKTGGLIEKMIVFPGLILLNIYVVYNNEVVESFAYNNYSKVLLLLKHL